MTSSAIAVEPPPTDARQLTKDGLLKRDPIYIESGRAILYAVRAPSPRLVLMRLDLQTGETSRYHKQSNLVEFRPTLSANGLSLAFQRMTGNDVCSLYLADLASGDERAISTGKKTSYNAALSPDGSELVYNLSGQLYRQNVSSGKELKLAHSSGRNDWPVWSPDNKQIVFASSRNGDFDLFVTSREGETIRQLTKSRGLDMRPAWSPDGEQICFTSNRDQNYELYLVRADGSNVRRLTRHDERDDFPSWSPDSKRIVYVSERGGRHDLFERTIRD
ncbi:MAG: hypothetical protein QGG36_16015 [Pirellulaceae bacterium]|jgi:TolB protein|nr:hypothetical protein [Pirellulaceae bacterium]